MMNKLPKINKSYYYFDDGKIKISRRMECTITEIIPFSEIDNEILEEWKEEVKECYWLYAKETDYFIKADLKISEDKTEKIVFVRTINNYGWFSLGLWAGTLDVEGKLNKTLTK